MNNNSLKCIFKCPSDEDQRHIFTNCEALKSSQNKFYVRYEDIFVHRKKTKIGNLTFPHGRKQKKQPERKTNCSTNKHLPWAYMPGPMLVYCYAAVFTVVDIN